MFLIPPTELLPLAARNTLGVLLAVIVLLVTEALPLGIVCLLSISMMVIFGCVESVPQALSGFTNQIVFFILASFGISEALTQADIGADCFVCDDQTVGKIGGTNKVKAGVVLDVTPEGVAVIV